MTILAGNWPFFKRKLVADIKVAGGPKSGQVPSLHIAIFEIGVAGEGNHDRIVCRKIAVGDEEVNCADFLG